MTARLIVASTLVLALAACTPPSAEDDSAVDEATVNDGTMADEMATEADAPAGDDDASMMDDAGDDDAGNDADAGGLPQMDIYLANISWTDQMPSIDAPQNATNHPGYDNQPAFAANSHDFYYSAETASGTTDVFLFGDASGEIFQVTDTPEDGEFSPRELGDATGIAFLHQNAEGVQHVTRSDFAGENRSVMIDLDPVGYFAFSGDGNQIAMFVLTEPFTLQVADLSTGDVNVVYENIDRALYATTDGMGAIFTTPRDGDDGFRAMYYSFTDGEIEYLFDLPGASQDYALVDAPDGLVGAFASSEGTLYYRTTNDIDWTPIADLSAYGLEGVTRMAVSDDSAKIAIVAAE